MPLEQLLLVLDLLGTFLFALEGGMAGIAANLDVLGLVVVAFVTAVGGGIIRDVLIGHIPPASIRDWRYGAVALAGAVCVFVGHASVERVPVQLMVTLDAAGLAMFACAGAAKALDFGLNPLGAVFMGGLTGVGGGTVRDIMLMHMPRVLYADIYAAAALLGALVMVLASERLGHFRAAVLGALVCFALRMVAFEMHWNLPHVAPGGP